MFPPVKFAVQSTVTATPGLCSQTLAGTASVRFLEIDNP